MVMKNNKKIMPIVLVIIIIGAIIFLQNLDSQKETLIGELQNNENTGLDIGNQAPDFILNSINGEKVQLSSFRGNKSVVVNFWATWCPPCREEMPAFEEIFAMNRDKLEILGVNLQESERAINNFVKDIPVTFTLLLDPNSEIKKLYNVFTQPVTYFINKEGLIVDKKFGPLTSKEMEDKFNKLDID